MSKILIVDDDPNFRESTRDLLEAYDHTVLVAADGTEALNQKPDLMILDVMMASVGEGFEISRDISNIPELRNMPIIMLSGIRAKMRIPFAFEPDDTWMPVRTFLEKPVAPDMLIEEVAKVLDQQQNNP